MATVETVDLIFHHGGKWEFSSQLSYVDGEAETILNFDIDFLSLPHILKLFNIDPGYPKVNKLYALKPGKRLHNGLELLVDDDNIRKLAEYNRTNLGVREIHIYGHHEVDVPIFIADVQLIEDDNCDNNELGTQYSSVQAGGEDAGS